MANSRILTVNDGQEIPATIGIMGEAIRQAAVYPPLLLHARALASQAGPHDYLGQAQAIYNDIVTNWRYVRDPAHMEALTVSPPEIMSLTLGIQADGTRTMGTGDCDDIAIALAALMQATGANIRLVTSAEPGRPEAWTHVFVQAEIPGYGWLTLDPVLYPDQEFGETVVSPRLGYWDLNGNQTSLSGCVFGEPAGMLSGTNQGSLQPGEQVIPFESIHDNGPEWGQYIDTMGYIGNASQFEIELMPEDFIDGERAIAPILALSPSDYEYVSYVGCPYPGMLAQGNTGYIYEWTPAAQAERLGYKPGDFFRAIGRGLKRLGKAIVNVVKWAWDKIETVFEATKFGRWILRIKDRVLEFATNIVTPFARIVGKWAPALAPLTALIPGIGPAIAAYVMSAGAAAKAYLKYGVPVINTIMVIDGEEVSVPVPAFVDDLQESEVINELMADVEFAESLSDAELQIYVDRLSELPVPEMEEGAEMDMGVMLEMVETLNETSESDLLALENERLMNAAENAAAAQEAFYAAQARNAQQSADTVFWWQTQRPEIRAMAENAQAAAQANQARVIEASQAAAIAAQARRDSAARAIDAEFAAIAENDPTYRSDKLIETALELESIGYGLKLEGV
jgi:hypothetical protein